MNLIRPEFAKVAESKSSLIGNSVQDAILQFLDLRTTQIILLPNHGEMQDLDLQADCYNADKCLLEKEDLDG